MADEKLLGAERAKDQAQSYRDAMERIRTRTDVTAKLLGGIGTAAIGAVGYAQFADVFPFHSSRWWLVALVGGVVAMICAVIYGVYRFNGATRSIVTTADVEGTIAANRVSCLNHFSKQEEEVVRRVYGDMAELNRVESLAAYQARAHRLERIAARTADTKVAATLRGRADQIEAEIAATQARLGALILRARSSDALFGWKTLIPVVVFAIGWYGMALASDAIQSDRSGEIEVAKSCAELKAAGPVGPLPGACAATPEEEKKDEQKRAEEKENAAVASVESAATSVLAASKECHEAARAADQDQAVCAPLKGALDLLTAEGPP